VGLALRGGMGGEDGGDDDDGDDASGINFKCAPFFSEDDRLAFCLAWPTRVTCISTLVFKIFEDCNESVCKSSTIFKQAVEEGEVLRIRREDFRAAWGRLLEAAETAEGVRDWKTGMRALVVVVSAAVTGPCFALHM
jgi:hypothetical protein